MTVKETVVCDVCGESSANGPWMITCTLQRGRNAVRPSGGTMRVDFCETHVDVSQDRLFPLNELRAYVDVQGTVALLEVDTGSVEYVSRDCVHWATDFFDVLDDLDLDRP